MTGLITLRMKDEMTQKEYEQFEFDTLRAIGCYDTKINPGLHAVSTLYEGKWEDDVISILEDPRVVSGQAELKDSENGNYIIKKENGLVKTEVYVLLSRVSTEELKAELKRREKGLERE